MLRNTWTGKQPANSRHEQCNIQGNRQERDGVGQQDDRLAILVLYISIFVVGLIENSLVLVVIFGKKESKTVNDIFITNFTISDIAFITVASPLSVYIYFVQQYGSTYVCKVWISDDNSYLLSQHSHGCVDDYATLFCDLEFV